MDNEFQGLIIKSWIEKADPADLSDFSESLLSDDESVWVVVKADNSSITVLEDNGGKTSQKVGLDFITSKTVFISSHKIRLIQAIKESLDPLIKIEEQAKETLLKHNISPSELHGGATEIKFARILNEWDKTQTVPTEDDRIYVYEAAKQSKEVSRAMVPIAKKWCEKIESYLKSYDATSRLSLAVLLRVAGKFDESLEVSNVIDLPQSKLRCNDHIRAMICCDRAAVFLDKFERNHNRDYLNQAEKYLKRAFANEQSEAVSICYQRLKSYREMK